MTTSTVRIPLLSEEGLSELEEEFCQVMDLMMQMFESLRGDDAETHIRELEAQSSD